MINFKDKQFVKDHAIDLIEFYRPKVKDNEYGGYYCAYLDDGSVYDKDTKDLVSTTRFILNFSFGIFLGGPSEYKDYIRHGLEFLEIVHRDEKNDGYHQLAKNNNPIISNKLTYGQAFCLCAVSNAYKAGIKEAYPLISRIYDFLEEKLWESEHSLYVDECSNDFKTVDDYRGQNSNMHMTEAMLAAYEATNENKYLDKAYTLAHRITVELAKKADGLIWEHYDKNWEIDWQYNKDDPKDLYNRAKPYRFLPGHLTEWAKLLMILQRYKPADWQTEAAEFLFDSAIKNSWDEKNGGMNYSFDKENNILDTDRSWWVLAETISASAVLALKTGKEKYWDIYNKCWEYSYNYFLDKKHGGWFSILSVDKKPLSDKKSPPGKTDYHVIGSCYEVARSMDYYK